MSEINDLFGKGRRQDDRARAWESELKSPRTSEIRQTSGIHHFYLYLYRQGFEFGELKGELISGFEILFGGRIEVFRYPSRALCWKWGGCLSRSAGWLRCRYRGWGF